MRKNIFRTNSKLSEYVRDGLAGKHSDIAAKYAEVLPNFIIIGAPKSATTTLAIILAKHADVFVSRPKEPKFFGLDYEKGWDWYGGKVFMKGKDYPIRGEASTMYASERPAFEYTAELMAKYIPKVKLIYMVRNPYERIVSQWRHLKGRLPNYPEFNEIMKCKKARRTVIGCSKYYARISAFRAHFPDEQIMCLTFEDFVKEPAAMLERIVSFIGADPSQKLIMDGKLPQENKAGAQGRAHVPVPECRPKLRQKIDDYLRDDTAKFLEYIGKPANYWDTNTI